MINNEEHEEDILVAHPSKILMEDEDNTSDNEDMKMILLKGLDDGLCSFGGLKMICGSHYIPKKLQGEDAHFIHEEGQTIGVADGVGSWSKVGIDGGEYARQLMHHCVTAFGNEPEGRINPMRVLNYAFLNTKCKGSSTACIITLTGNCLHVVNLGDSGLMLLRDDKFLFRSPAQQNRFNYPYQLGNNENDNHPGDADEMKIPVMPGDYIVAATDGLFDNMYPSDVEDIVRNSRHKGHTPEVISLDLALFAQQNSFDKNYKSPFYREAKKAGIKRKGGKIDDITVIVGQIVQLS